MQMHSSAATGFGRVVPDPYSNALVLFAATDVANGG